MYTYTNVSVQLVNLKSLTMKERKFPKIPIGMKIGKYSLLIPSPAKLHMIE